MITNHTTKVCRFCHEEKPIDEFHKNRASKDGHCARCKSCLNAYGRQRWHQMAEKGMETNKRKKHKYDGVVYFVSGSGKVKIGICIKDLNKRLKAIQGSCPVPLTLIGYIKTTDTRRLEIELHNRFKEFHSHAEWFFANKAISDYIRDHAFIVNSEIHVQNQSIRVSY